jgi:antitoxin PrlF
MPKRVSKPGSGAEADCCDSGCCDSGCACRGVIPMECCRVEAVVTLDRRGQMVLPKEVRDRAGYGPDERLAVVTWERKGEVCCVTLQKADDLAAAVRSTYGPVISRA